MVHWTLTKIDRRYVRMTSDDHAKTNKIFGLAIHQKRSTSTLFLLLYKMMLSAVSRSHLVTYFVWPRRHRPTVRMILSKHMYICNYVDGKKKRDQDKKKKKGARVRWRNWPKVVVLISWIYYPWIVHGTVRQNPEELDILSFLIKIQNLLPLSLTRFSSWKLLNNTFLIKMFSYKNCSKISNKSAFKFVLIITSQQIINY